MEQNPNRVNFLIKLLRMKRQNDANILLQNQISDNNLLIQGFQHGKFGSFCISSGDSAKAQEHLNKSRQIIEPIYPYSNVWLNLGLVQVQKHNYVSAIDCFKKAISVSPHNCQQEAANEVVYSKQLNAFSTFVDAHTNLAVMYSQVKQYQLGIEACEKSLQLKPEDNEATVNYSDLLRQLGKKEQAIDYSWSQIQRLVRKQGNKQYQRVKKIHIQPLIKEQEENKQISILTVKWGKRYNADYVNKIYNGIKRHTTYEITRFFCFTDDGTGLNQSITVVPLEQGWKKWWGKASLFNANIEGKKFYIDLDMVITNNLDQLFSYNGDFALLKSGELQCQQNHINGYNSSIMIWQNNALLTPIYEQLKKNFETINKCIVRFDFWLQMTVQNADYLQQIYPRKVIDFLRDAKTVLPQTSSIVCFARKPKPQDYPAEWIKEHWI